MRRRLLASLLVPLVLLVASIARAGKAPDLRSWAEGEVRYLLLDEERAQWKALKTDEERQAFIAAWWARRDPDPSTPENEYQAEIARRVEEANRLFRGEGRSGWLTDRGRIYVTFGKPDEVTENAPGTVVHSGGSLGREGSRSTATEGSILWTYHRVPDWEMPPDAHFEFRASNVGVYRLAHDPPADWKRKLPAAGAVSPRAAAPAPAPAPAGGKPGKGGSKGDAGQVKDMLLGVLRGAAPGALALEAWPLCFPVGQKDALVVVPFTLGARHGEAPLELLAAAFDAGEKPLHTAVIALPAGDAAPGKARSFAFLLAPGSYRLALAVREAGAGAALAARTLPLVVPAFDDGAFRASSLVPSRGVETRPDEAVKLDQLVDGIVIGNLAVDASPGNRFARGSTVEVFYMLAGARAKPDGSLDVTADYRVLKGADVKSHFPTQPLAGPVCDQGIPLTGLDPGEYRLEVEITDRASAAKVTDAVALVIE